jgi:hypothetical protein
MSSSSFGTPALTFVLALTLASAWAPPAAGEQILGPATLGADLRLREVYIGNIGFNDQSPTANRVFQRYRLRGWAQYAFNEHVAANARLTWEGRHYGLPPESAWPVPGFERWYGGFVLLDGLTLDLKRIADSPLSVKAGRQDIRLGDGWLVMDGTPIDGSRTFYLDAARATYAFESSKTTLDLIYIDQYANTDRFPRPLNGDSEDQTEQFETGAILYLRNRSCSRTRTWTAISSTRATTPTTPRGASGSTTAPPSPPRRTTARSMPSGPASTRSSRQTGSSRPRRPGSGAPTAPIRAPPSRTSPPSASMRAWATASMTPWPTGCTWIWSISPATTRARRPTRPSTPCGGAGPSGASSTSTSGPWTAGLVRPLTCCA